MRSQAIIEKIEKKLKELEEDPSKRTISLVFQFNFTKEDGTVLKSFVLDLKDLKIYEGTFEGPDGEITVTDEDFFAWATKEATYEDLKERVKINGNLESVKKLMEKFHK